MKFIYLAFVLSLLFSLNSFAENWVYPKTDAEMEQRITNLNWINESGEYTLIKSEQNLKLNGDWSLLLGADAQEFYFLVNGSYDSQQKVIAALVSEVNDSLEQIFISHQKIGYVDDYDWSDIETNELLEAIQEATEEDNKVRRELGLGTINVLSWGTEPTYDSEGNRAFWSIVAREEGLDTDTINEVGLKLSKDGFTKFRYIYYARNKSKKDLLVKHMGNHQYENGFKYSDFDGSTAMASVGLASLVALNAGSKINKGVIAGLVATALVFAKKLWFLLFIPFIFFGRWLKEKIFR